MKGAMMTAAELHRHVCAKFGREEDDDRATAVFLDWASWRGLRATGYRSRCYTAPKSQAPELLDEDDSRRRIPGKFWRYLARAIDAPLFDTSLCWTFNSVSYTLRVAEDSRGGLPAGGWHVLWEGVLVDRFMVEALLEQMAVAPPDRKSDRRPLPPLDQYILDRPDLTAADKVEAELRREFGHSQPRPLIRERFAELRNPRRLQGPNAIERNSAKK